MKRLALILLALAHPLFAAVTIAPVVPSYSYQVLPGSTRQVAVVVTNGAASPCGPSTSPSCTGTVSWSVTSSTGGATATFTDITHTAVSSITGGLATMLVNIGGSAGGCSITPASGGGIGTYAVSSTATVTVTATSTDSGTPSTSFVFRVCAPTGDVKIAPAYQQLYQGQHGSLQSWVTGDVDETGVWSIVSQPAGGDGTFTDTTSRDADFHATVTGRYTLKYSGNASDGPVGQAIVYVPPLAMPSYSVTSKGARPTPCYPEPGMTVYPVGAGYTYATPISVPAWASWTLGTTGVMEQIHNTGGSSPSLWHNYIQIENSGTATQPVIVCGVDDSGTGYMPILDGTNATTQSGTSTALAGFALVLLWPSPAGGHYGPWQGGSAGPSYVTISGLDLQNANPGLNYVPPGGGTPQQWIDGNGCVSAYSGSYIDIVGDVMDSCTNGVFMDANGNNLWATITTEVSVRGNHITHSGWSTDFIDHQLYLQSFWTLVEGNLLDKYVSTALGACIKDRGVETILRYNYCASDPGSAGPTRIIDHVERQDSGSYVSFEQYLALPGQTNCAFSAWCLGDTAGANIIAGYQESAQKEFDYGNALTNASQAAEFQIHYGEDHDGGMEAQNGTLYSYNNTIDNAQIVYDNTSNNNGVMYLQQRVLAQNNILYNTAFGKISFNNFEPLIFNGLVNLTPLNTSITTPILGGSYNAGTTTGWQAGCDLAACPWNLTNPLNTHIYNLTSGNYPTTGTTPYNSTTLVPGSGSPAVGAGVAPGGILVQMPVRYQFDIASGALKPRLFPLTLGGEDQSGGTPTVANPTCSPAAGTYSSTQSVTCSSSTGGSTTVCTINGSTPTHGSPVCTSISVATTLTLKALSFEAGFTDSSVMPFVYTISGAAAAPTFAPPAGTYGSTQTVTLSSTSGCSGFLAWNTTNAQSGGNLTGVSTTNPITVSASEAIFAQVQSCPGLTNSSINSATYVITTAAATPTFSPVAGTYGPAQTVTISTTTPSATIYYTTDGSTPTTLSTVYSGPINVAFSQTVKAIATASGFAQSAVGTAVYVINGAAVAPTFSPVAGSYGPTQSVTLATSTSGCTGSIVWNTTNAQTSGNLTGTSSTNPLSVSSSETVYAQVQSCPTWANSTISSAVYVINGPVANPTCTPPPTTYTSVQNVTCSSSTAGSTTVCTIDGSTPTHGSPVCSAITVGATLTLKALSFETSWSDSSVVSNAYTINLVPGNVKLSGTVQIANGQVGK